MRGRPNHCSATLSVNGSGCIWDSEGDSAKKLFERAYMPSAVQHKRVIARCCVLLALVDELIKALNLHARELQRLGRERHGRLAEGSVQIRVLLLASAASKKKLI